MNATQKTRAKELLRKTNSLAADLGQFNAEEMAYYKSIQDNYPEDSLFKIKTRIYHMDTVLRNLVNCTEVLEAIIND